MQANNIWAGNDYAYVYDRGHKTITDHAQRVRVIRVFKQKENRWDERLKTFVEVTPLSDDGEPKIKDGKEIVKTVKARDLLDQWDDYANERDHRREERQILVRRREEEARMRKLEDQQILEYLQRLGLSPTAISFGYGNIISIKREEVMKWIRDSMQAKSTSY